MASLRDDRIFTRTARHQAVYEADKRGPSARKLATLIDAVEKAKRHFIVLVAHGEAQNRLLDNGLAILNAAVEEARKP